ncbi:hypothetical protein LOTGIDRAFT_153153 [Lottia gigantea]|uniref:Uncharacterized protein n=1 Tax=Lottia gigantea TaxID=225164 RepID=V3ZQL6_LOTGI|nr:hypothetical protein LOTGIDRAFT_153153 [Lottia gigantea]ESO93698.1 hypothetical protein LOTGIDRAFT_153153 [Lottia gigantea]
MDVIMLHLGSNDLCKSCQKHNQRNNFVTCSQNFRKPISPDHAASQDNTESVKKELDLGKEILVDEFLAVFKQANNSMITLIQNTVDNPETPISGRFLLETEYLL